MNGVAVYLADDRVLVDRLAEEDDGPRRVVMLDDSITAGEAAIAATNDPVAAANAMIAVAGSYLLAANEATFPTTAEARAAAAARWVARAVKLTEGAPDAALYFIPRAGTIVAAAMVFVPDETRRKWMELIDPWPQMVADAMVARHGLERDGTVDLIVGLSLLEGAEAARPDEAQAVTDAAVSALERAEHSLSMAGEVDLATEARRALDSPLP